MNYIILAAGEGKRLHPFTKNYPKCLMNIGNGQRAIQRMTELIKKFDPQAQIHVVLGFKHKEVIPFIKGCKVTINPFYSVTNSVASLWFMKDLLADSATIINGDVIVSEKLMERIVSVKKLPTIFYDSSSKVDGDYNVQIHDNYIAVMGKELNQYHGEYVGITKLDKQSAVLLRNEICSLIDCGCFNEWYENALVQMILNADFKLNCFDVSEYEWHEIDTINDLIFAKELIKKEGDQ